VPYLPSLPSLPPTLEPRRPGPVQVPPLPGPLSGTQRETPGPGPLTTLLDYLLA